MKSLRIFILVILAGAINAQSAENTSRMRSIKLVERTCGLAYPYTLEHKLFGETRTHTAMFLNKIGLINKKENFLLHRLYWEHLIEHSVDKSPETHALIDRALQYIRYIFALPNAHIKQVLVEFFHKLQLIWARLDISHETKIMLSKKLLTLDTNIPEMRDAKRIILASGESGRDVAIFLGLVNKLIQKRKPLNLKLIFRSKQGARYLRAVIARRSASR